MTWTQHLLDMKYRGGAWWYGAENGTGGLHIIERNMKYQDIFKKSWILLGRERILGRRWIFQQDNNPKQTAKIHQGGLAWLRFESYWKCMKDFWGPPNSSFAAKYSDLCYISSFYQLYSTEHNVAYKHGCHFLQSKSPHNTVSVQSCHHTPLFCTHQPTHLHKLKRDNSCNSFWFLQQFSICSSSDPLPFSDPGFFYIVLLILIFFKNSIGLHLHPFFIYVCRYEQW